jgi:hypothetical protein
MIGGFIGFVAGIIGGGYLGLIVGGTFLGSLKVYEQIGIEGYELTTYVGSIMGALFLTIIGVKIAVRMAEKR